MPTHARAPFGVAAGTGARWLPQQRARVTWGVVIRACQRVATRGLVCRELVCEPRDTSVAQAALRPDLWRVDLCRNCQVINPHIPWASVVLQSNTDATPVPTKHQAEMYCCNYCSKHGKRKGQAAALYEVLDDMESKDASAQRG